MQEEVVEQSVTIEQLEVNTNAPKRIRGHKEEQFDVESK